MCGAWQSTLSKALTLQGHRQCPLPPPSPAPVVGHDLLLARAYCRQVSGLLLSQLPVVLLHVLRQSQVVLGLQRGG